MKTLAESELRSLTDSEKLSIRKLKERLREVFVLRSLILFGSKARGNFEEWSDVDLLVLVEEEKTWNNREKLSDITFDINMEFETQLSCILENGKNWDDEGDSIWLPLKDNIVQEGIAIEI